MLLLQQMLVLFFYMGIGFVCGKKNIITDDVAKTFSWIVVNIANTALILSAGVSDTKTVTGKALATTFVVAICVFFFLILLGYLLVPLLRVPAADKGVFRVMTIFSNIGFMGFPVIFAVYGEEALLYASIFLFPYNILIYTYGICAMKKENDDHGKMQWTKICNAGVVAGIISLICYLADVQVPSFVQTAVSGLSGLTAPLSMIVIGQSMVHMRIRDLITDVRLLIFSIIKLIVIPIFGILLLRIWVKDPMLLGVCMIMLATPVGSMTAMLAQQYDGDYMLASKGVSLTTILSVLTIPLVSAIVM